jgi:hypothetical protein
LGEDGATYDWELSVAMVILELTVSWRFALTDDFGAYFQAGPRIYFVEATMDASAGGAEFGRQTQGSHAFGAVGAFGGDFLVGPGSAYLALEYGGSDLNTRLTGDSNSRALAVDGGYRLTF